MLVSAIQQHESTICVHTSFPSHLSLPPAAPIPPVRVVTEHLVEFPVLYRSFLLAVCFTHGSVFTSLLLSQFVPPLPPMCPSILWCHCSESQAWVTGGVPMGFQAGAGNNIHCTHTSSTNWAQACGPILSVEDTYTLFCLNGHIRILSSQPNCVKV